jgi:hypothetical protein
VRTARRGEDGAARGEDGAARGEDGAARGEDGVAPVERRGRVAMPCLAKEWRGALPGATDLAAVPTS